MAACLANRRKKNPHQCDHPPQEGSRYCVWHNLMRQPIEVQEEAAKRRRETSTETRSRAPAKEWPAGHRYCGGCRSMIPLYYVRGTRCRACASLASHRRRVEAQYEWPEGASYDTLYQLQNGECAICRNRPRRYRLAVDHDHHTGMVRGLLCRVCNQDLLGAAHHSAQILLNAAYYLTSPPANMVGSRQEPD